MIRTVALGEDMSIVMDFDYEGTKEVLMYIEPVPNLSIADWLTMQVGEMMYVEEESGTHTYMIAGKEIELRRVYIVPWRVMVN